MSQSELLKRVVATLDTAKIGYMITGSVVSSLQGEPRSTHDIDIVLVIRPEQIAAISRAFPPPGYYVDADAIQDAIRQKASFNLIDMQSGYKVDFWLLTDTEFDRIRFARRIHETIDGSLMAISSPEDTILMKLNWARLSGGSEKQFTDALRVFELQHARLDQNYLASWARRLDVTELWDRLLAEARPL